MLRRLGPRVWFPIIICLWGTVSTLTSVINNYGSFIAIRLALGCSCVATSASPLLRLTHMQRGGHVPRRVLHLVDLVSSP